MYVGLLPVVTKSCRLDNLLRIEFDLAHRFRDWEGKDCVLALGEHLLIVIWPGGENYMPWQRKSLNQGTLLIKLLAPSRGTILMNSQSCQYPKAPPKCHHHKTLRIEFLTHELSRRLIQITHQI